MCSKWIIKYMHLCVPIWSTNDKPVFFGGKLGSQKKLTLVGFGVSYTIISLRSIKEYIHWKYDGFMWSITYFLPKKE